LLRFLGECGIKELNCGFGIGLCFGKLRKKCRKIYEKGKINEENSQDKSQVMGLVQ
jgi:hypothetical protein